MPLELVRDLTREYLTNPLLRSPNEREFLPAALEIMEKPASPAGRLVSASICLAVLIAIVWAIFGKIDIIATAPGKIIPVGNSKIIQPIEIGRVKAIKVADGDAVNASQVLIELDPISARADMNRYAEQLRRAKLDLEKYRALILADHERREPVLTNIPVEASEREVQTARVALDAEYRQQRAAVLDLNQQIAAKTADVAAAESAIAKVTATLPFIQEQADLRSKLMELQFSNRLAYLQSQQSLEEQKRQVVVLESQRNSSSAERLSLIHKRSEAEANYSKSLSDAFEKAQGLVADLQASEAKSAESFYGKTIRSPIDGTVQQLIIHTVGGVVTPAQALMTIVPKSGGLVVEARLSNDDIGFVRIGQVVQVKVSPFNFTKYGLIPGVVTDISRDSIEEDPSRKGSVGSSAEKPVEQLSGFTVHVRLSKDWIETESGISHLGAGMIVTAEIQTGRRRIIDYMLSPFQRKMSEGLHER